MVHVKLIGFCIAGLLVLIMCLVQLQKRRHKKAHIHWNEEWDGAEGFDEILGVHKVTDGVRIPVVDTSPTLLPQTSELQELFDQALKKDIYVLQILAESNHLFMGYELLQALQNAGLTYGDMDIFHYYADDGEALFSVAQATEPGTFDMTQIGRLSCHGLSVFIQLQNDQDDEYRLSKMLEVVNQLVNDLGGQVKDGLTGELIPQDVLNQINEMTF